MRKRLALLAFRVARWLAPQLFNGDNLNSIEELQVRLRVLRTLLCAMPKKDLDGVEGKYVIERLRSVESLYRDIEKVGSEYELVKIELRPPDGLSKAGLRRVTEGEDPQQVMREETKHKLFSAVAEGFAKSAEIEKFMYFRTVGQYKIVGIQLYLKHDK